VTPVAPVQRIFEWSEKMSEPARWDLSSTEVLRDARVLGQTPIPSKRRELVLASLPAFARGARQ
jgi:hypothetical protein